MISLNCPHCGKSLAIPDEYAGQRGKCKGCGGYVEVPLTTPLTSSVVSRSGYDVQKVQGIPTIECPSCKNMITDDGSTRCKICGELFSVVPLMHENRKIENDASNEPQNKSGSFLALGVVLIVFLIAFITNPTLLAQQFIAYSIIGLLVFGIPAIIFHLLKSNDSPITKGEDREVETADKKEVGQLAENTQRDETFQPKVNNEDKFKNIPPKSSNKSLTIGILLIVVLFVFIFAFISYEGEIDNPPVLTDEQMQEYLKLTINNQKVPPHLRPKALTDEQMNQLLVAEAAAQGDASAQYNLGVMYAKGKGVPEGDAEAVKWFRLAAEQGHAGAQFNLGVMYDKGEGVTKDAAEAVKWYRLAAEQGHAEAQYNLGVSYGNGKGVPRDYAEAMKWGRLAAEQGYADAQFFLGMMYDKIMGVPKDYAEALKWYRLAAEQGNADAQKRLDNLGLSYNRGEDASSDNTEVLSFSNVSRQTVQVPAPSPAPAPRPHTGRVWTEEEIIEFINTPQPPAPDEPRGVPVTPQMGLMPPQPLLQAATRAAAAGTASPEQIGLLENARIPVPLSPKEIAALPRSERRAIEGQPRDVVDVLSDVSVGEMLPFAGSIIRSRNDTRQNRLVEEALAAEAAGRVRPEQRTLLAVTRAREGQEQTDMVGATEIAVKSFPILSFIMLLLFALIFRVSLVGWIKKFGRQDDTVSKIREDYTMNSKQKIVSLCVVAVLLGMILFPPFHMVMQAGTLNEGFAFILDPPTNSTINVPQLSIQVIVVCIIGIISWIFVKN